MARSADDLSLPEVEEIINQDAEMRQILVDIARRQAGGASKGGRYNKHDTARLRFVRDKALKGLRLGELQSDASKFNDVAAAIQTLIPKLEARSK